MEKIPITKEGFLRIREKVDYLISVERPRITKAIEEARSHGDLKENAEYHAAREQQSLNEAHINNYEYALANAEVIDVSKLKGTTTVVFGATVHLYNLNDSKEYVYQIVGEYEADISQNKISIATPIARALIGKSVDDEVTVTTPSGEIVYEITDINYE